MGARPRICVSSNSLSEPVPSPPASFDEADLNGFVDGRIDPSRAAVLAQSLAGDRDARARIDGWKRQNETLRTLFASVLFEPVPVRLSPVPLVTGVAAGKGPDGLPLVAAGPDGWKNPAKPAEPPGVTGRTFSILATTSIGMAMVGFVAGALTSLGSNGFGFAPLALPGAETTITERMSAGHSFAARAAETHQTFLTDLNRPVELTASEGPRLLRWLQHSLNVPIKIPDLQRQGWTLIGGRIVPGQYGPAAFVVYGTGADRLGLYVAHTPKLQAEGIGTVEVGPMQTSVSTWGDGTFGYALTTSHDVRWLDHNGGALRNSVRMQIRDPTPD